MAKMANTIDYISVTVRFTPDISGILDEYVLAERKEKGVPITKNMIINEAVRDFLKAKEILPTKK